MRKDRTHSGLIAAAVVGVAMLCAAAPTAQAAELKPKVTRLQAAAPKQMLFIGNSYLYYGDAMHNHVRRMAIAAKHHDAKVLVYKLATISGSALFDHDITSYLKPGQLRVKGPFEVVVLQGGSGAILSEQRRAKFLAAVKTFAAEIKKAGGETALYMTHAYVKPHKRFKPGMIDDLVKLYVETGNAVGALVIPVGLAFEEAYRRKPGIVLHKAFDGTHPDLNGTFLAACVVYMSLYGQSPVGNSYDYYGKIDKETVRFLQQVAHDTVTRFYGKS